MNQDAGWTRDWRPPYLRHGLRYYDSPAFRTMSQVLNAMDPLLDRFENRGDLLTVRNNKIWMWPSYGCNLRTSFPTLSVEVSFHCILESFVVYISEEIFESPMENIVNFFGHRVYSEASWDSVVPSVAVRMRTGHTEKCHFISRTATLGTVLGRHAPVVRKIYLSIQQAEHIPIDRGPRIVWHNWRWVDHWLASDSDSSE